MRFLFDSTFTSSKITAESKLYIGKISQVLYCSKAVTEKLQTLRIQAFKRSLDMFISDSYK